MQTVPKSWQELDHLKWLGKEAPRYTSYPSAHHFGELTPATYSDWLAALPREDSIGLYVHVPFCEQMCWFCGCNTQITRQYEPIEAYVGSLIHEIGMVGSVLGFRPRVHALHFGGGSPGILQPGTIMRLFSALHLNFDILPGAEISIELDPRRVTKAKAQAYGYLGFNRVNLGIQDTQAVVQAAINRVQPMETILSAIGTLRGEGLQSLGIDLVYGLPHQTAETLGRTLEDILQLNAQRISAFSYAHVPWMKKHQRLIDESALPGLGEKAMQYLRIETQLTASGYAGVGIDHFATPDDGLAKALASRTLRRNFMGYTDLPNDRLIALGASSISELDQGIAQNISQATSYRSLIASGKLPTVRGWAYRDDDAVRREVIADLMCYFEVDTGAILHRHGLPKDYFDEEMAGLEEFAVAGLVTVDNGRAIFDAPLKMLVRTVAAVFDRYARTTESGPRYSRVA